MSGESVEILPEENEKDLLLEEEEVFDDDFKINPDDLDNNEQSELLFEEKYDKDDLFLIVFSEDDTLKDILASVENIDLEQRILKIKDEENNEYSLKINENNHIILSSDDYTIVEIDRVEEFDLNELDKVNFVLTREIYPEIELDLKEKDKKDYSVQEKKEDLINSLIESYSAFGNKLLINKLSDISDIIFKLIEESDDKKIFNNYFDFLSSESFINKNTNWLIPITDDDKIFFRIEESEDSKFIDFTKYLDDVYKLKTTNDLNYNDILLELYRDNTLINNGKGYTINYNGHYFRDCNDSNPCNGINGEYTYDENKTFHSILRNDEKIVSEQKLSVIGFYLIPYKLGNRIFNSKLFDLNESSFFSKYLYSYHPFKKLLNYSKIIPHIIDNTTEKLEYDGKKINSYHFSDEELRRLDSLSDSKQMKREFFNILKNNLPDYEDIINSYDKEILNEILNYSDFNRLFSFYDINFNNLTHKTRENINLLIKQNIKRNILTYNRSVKRKVVKKIKRQEKILSTEEKIQKTRDYIFSVLNIPLKNFYIQKFIDIYSRKPKTNEDQNFLYEKNSDNKFLCRHYEYSIRCSNDENLFFTMKNLFGNPPKEGNVYCKVCGEFICTDEFSIFEGFSDGIPTRSNEKIEQKVQEEVLNKDQLECKKRFDRISSYFSINLTYADSQFIIDLYDNIKEEEIINTRYNRENAYKSHPRYKGVKEKYTFIKPAKTKEDKINNKKNNDLMKKELEVFKQETIINNHIVSDIFLILFLVQTADPPYKVSKSLELFNEITQEDLEKDSYKNISAETIDNVLKFLYRMVKTNDESKYWKGIDRFLTEANIFTSLPSFPEQFFNMSKYFFKNKKIIDKYSKYFKRKKDPYGNLFIRETWQSYKPSLNNVLVQNIDKKMDESKELKNDNYENYSLLQSINDKKAKYELLDIPFSEILMNKSYQRLYDYSVHLHGKSSNIPLIDLLINRFIETMDDQSIRSNMIDLGWDPLKKSIRNIDYSEFKKTFIVDTTEYYKSKNPEDINTINTYIHVHFNNFNGMLLNGHPKRFYQYTEPVVFPMDDFKDLLENKKDMIDKLFGSYCLDKDGELQETFLEDVFITNLISDLEIERKASCYSKLSVTSEDFYKILEFKNLQNSLPFIETVEKDLKIENRLYEFLRNSNLLNHDADENFIIFNSIIEKINSDDDYDLDDINSNVIDKSSDFIDTISRYIQRVDTFNKDIVRRFKVSFGKNLNSIETILNEYFEINIDYEKNISLIKNIIGRLSNNIPEKKTGTIFHNNIPKEWKSSDTVNDNISEFINKNEFLLQYDIFIPFTKRTNIGFNKYRIETKLSKCFEGLNNFLKEYFGKINISEINGKDSSKFTKDFSNDLKKFLFLFYLVKIIEYIEDLSDEQSLPANQANLLYRSLEEYERLNLEESVTILNDFLLDLLIHFVEESKDPLWLYQMDDISNKLSKQSEREKQNLMNSLETKTSDARLVETQMQAYGIGEGGQGGWYKKGSDSNLEHIGTDEYTVQVQLERNLTDVPDDTDLSDGLIPDDEKEKERLETVEEESYDQHDVDQEDEGLDDADDFGNYHED